MLSNKEISVMQCIYKVARSHNDSCIISNKYIMQCVPEKFKLQESHIEGIVKQLEYDGYLECTVSERKGETVNVISLKNKGKAFAREMILRRRELFNTMLWRVIFGGIGAIGALIVSKILGG